MSSSEKREMNYSHKTSYERIKQIRGETVKIMQTETILLA